VADTSGGNGVFVSSKEIYEKLLSLERQIALLPTKVEFDQLEDRLRKAEIGVKAIPPALILVIVTVILAFVQMKQSG
jgi:hypothetical protein